MTGILVMLNGVAVAAIMTAATTVANRTVIADIEDAFDAIDKSLTALATRPLRVTSAFSTCESGHLFLPVDSLVIPMWCGLSTVARWLLVIAFQMTWLSPLTPNGIDVPMH